MLSILKFFFILFQYNRYISLSHYFSAMNNAQPPKEVAIVILEAIKNLQILQNRCSDIQ